ncbi:MAG: DUF2309 domain-containing protein [Bacteroidetes bacterium]|nr:MAG: DUF2309 domain-containing protein [Bacteroidota bacterium]
MSMKMKEQEMRQITQAVCDRIAPMWPLKNFVAVNPYLGMKDMSFNKAARKLAKRNAIRMTLPIGFYIDEYKKGNIQDEDIEKALQQCNYPMTKDEFISEIHSISEKGEGDKGSLNTLIDLIDPQSEYKQLMIDRISSWAASYFDAHLSLWKGEKHEQGLFATWRAEAEIDLAPEIAGIKKFRAILKSLPKDEDAALKEMIDHLELKSDELETYLHTLLLRINGWSSYIRGLDWNNDLYSEKTDQLRSFLTILLAWEYVTFRSFFSKELTKKWENCRLEYGSDEELNWDQSLDNELVMQEAFDLAHQRVLREKFAIEREQKEEPKSKAQAVFCIDVRSEVYRRNLEAVDAGIETIGFAGFFGFPIQYKEIGVGNGNNQCPVLIPSGPVVSEVFVDKDIHISKEKWKVSRDQFSSTAKNFRSGAVSSFSFVSPMGLYYLPKLLKSAFLGKRLIKNQKVTKWEDPLKTIDLSQIPLQDKVNMAASALTAMGLKNRLAKLVFILGHGSTSTNNPHASGLDCGACGGHSGEVNALTAVKIFNDPLVRLELRERGITIPNDTLFVAGLHDTTSDEISFLEESKTPVDFATAISDVKKSFKKATVACKLERSAKFDFNQSKPLDLAERANDWSQVRPEWGLAGCSSFVVAPRRRTNGIDLGGKSFLHNYDWKKDEGYKVLETIMTAPMVVTSWINLQYYASVTDNQHFGAGNKTLHNVTAGIGVLEGSGGDLRTGLPLQSVHNGKKFQHLPNRLCVLIEAPIDEINEILSKHGQVRELFDNSWIYLFVIDEKGQITSKYINDLCWETLEKVSLNDELELQTV